MTWTLRLKRADEPVSRILAFLHAGGWSTSFRSWGEVVPADVEVLVAQLPGREKRAAHPHAASFLEIVEGVLGELPDDGLPLNVFGHSFGSIAAYEMTRALRAAGREVQALVVSGKQPPCFPSYPPFASESSDEGLMKRLVDMGGISDGLRDRPALLTPFLGAIRSDLQLMERYERPWGPCDVPILAVHAVGDPVVVGERLHLWSAETTASFQMMEIEGDHFGIYNPKQFKRVMDQMSWSTMGASC